MKEQIQKALLELDAELSPKAAINYASYGLHRSIIESAFAPFGGSGYNEETVLKRLVLIDSLYSTNASYSYFSMEEMSERICALGSERDSADYFYGLVLGKGDPKRLFEEAYGIRKDGSEGSKQISLLSKYAYYLLIQDAKSYPLGFPIYDSLAIKSYPLVCRHLGIKPVKAASLKEDICAYVAALDGLRVRLFEGLPKTYKMQDFDLLDAYLWRIGKMNGGNFSLLLDRTDYVRLISNLELGDTQSKTKKSKVEGFSSDAFNAEVLNRCRTKGERALDGISKESIISLYKHWLRLYTKQD